jgi:hypothetical protein
MGNLALNKEIEEAYPNSAAATNGIITGYTGNKGFCQFWWPGNFTLDLGKVYSIKCIRFLLWDGLGTSQARRDPRQYLYRLLTSEDHKTWNVLFVTEGQGYNGWQVFQIPNGRPMRFIRIHGLHNTKNPMFHVVEIQAFNSEADPIDTEIMLEKVISEENRPIEIDERLPIQKSFQIIINQLEQVINEYDVFNSEPFQDVIQKLKIQVRDVAAIESNLESIKRHITQPVQEQLEKASSIGLKSLQLGKFSFWGFWVGLIGGLLAIISIILNIIKS